MKRFLIFLFIVFSLTACKSQAKYNELKIQKEKAEIKTLKLEEKLKSLNSYNKRLQDSLSDNL